MNQAEQLIEAYLGEREPISVGKWTVGAFLQLLSHRITQWDMRANKGNPYALGLMFEQVSKIEAELKRKGISKDSSFDSDIEALLDLVEEHFTTMRWRDKFIRDVEKYLDTGQKPRLR